MTFSLSGLVYLYDRTVRVLPPLQSLFLLFVRIYWGWLFSRTGYGKLMNLDRTTDFFASLGMPFPHLSALLVGLTELVGGVLMGLGLGARFVGLILSLEMLGAFAVAHRNELTHLLSSPEEFWSAPPFSFLFASLVVFLFGAGMFSLDHLLSRISKGLK